MRDRNPTPVGAAAPARGRLRRWLEEPLVHFVAPGALLFVIHQRAAPRTAAEREVRIDAAQVQGLAAGFAATRGRAPDQAELQALVEELVREEVLYRQAVALGIDRGDTLVRRRLVQKLEFLMEDLSDAVAPAEEELALFLQTHAERYRASPSIAFREVFVNSPWRGTNADAMALGWLEHLRRAGTGVDERALGDKRVLEAPAGPLELPLIAARFGAGFATRLAELAPGEWSGPLASDSGLHLVLVSARIEGALPELEAVRAQVETDWRAERRRQSAERFYRDLRERHAVRIEWPPAPAGDDAAAER